MYVSHKSNLTVVKSEFISTDLIEEEYDVQFEDIGQDVLYDCPWGMSHILKIDKCN